MSKEGDLNLFKEYVEGIDFEMEWLELGEVEVVPRTLQEVGVKLDARFGGYQIRDLVREMGGFFEESGEGDGEMVVWLVKLEERLGQEWDEADSGWRVVDLQNEIRKATENEAKLDLVAEVVAELALLAVRAESWEGREGYFKECVHLMAYGLGGGESGYDRALKSYGRMKRWVREKG